MVFTTQLGNLTGKSEMEAIMEIANHIRRLQDELEYRLSNLDSSNITEIDASDTVISSGYLKFY